MGRVALLSHLPAVCRQRLNANAWSAAVYKKNDLPEWGGDWRAPSRGDNSACAGLPLLLGCLDSSDAHFRLIGLAAIGQDACFNWLFFLDQSVFCEAVLHLSHQGVIKAV